MISCGPSWGRLTSPLTLFSPSLSLHPTNPHTSVLAGKLAAVLQATGMTRAELAAKIERDPRFLAVPYPSLLSRIAFLMEESGTGIQRISLSSMACMPLRRFGEMYGTYEAYLTDKLGEAAAGAAKKGTVTVAGAPVTAAVALQAGRSNDKRRRWMGGLLGLEREWGTLLWRQSTTALDDGSGTPYPLPPRNRNGFVPPKGPSSSSSSRSRQPPSASLSQQSQAVLTSR